jgi:hypothetical protein
MVLKWKLKETFGALLSIKCPKCSSNAKGYVKQPWTDKELRMSCECPKCKTHLIEKYEERGSQLILVSKEVVEE